MTDAGGRCGGGGGGGGDGAPGAPHVNAPHVSALPPADPLPADPAPEPELPGSSVGTRRWNERSTAPPLDLRLAPVALGAWAGGLTGLTGIWPTIGAASTVLMIAWWLPSARKVLVLVGVYLMLGAACAQLVVHRAASDPLQQIADRGGFAIAEVVLTADPLPMNGAYPHSPRPVRYRAAAQSVTVGADRQPSSARVVLFGAPLGDFSAGDHVQITGMTSRDDYAVVPAVRITVRARPTLIESASWWQRWASGVRTQMRELGIKLGGDGGALLPGLVVGDTSLLSERLTADARTTGLTHLVAVSGSHFTLLCGCIVVLLRRFGLRLALIAAGFVGAGIILVVGPQPSVLRAAVMGSIGLAGLLTARPRTPLPALFGAITVLVCVSPELARSAGFAMSVLATAGLILFAPSWSAVLVRHHIPPAVADLAAMSAAASVMTLPIVVMLSGAIPTTGVLANLAAGPAVAAGLVLGSLTAVIAPFAPGLAEIIGTPASWCAGWIARVAHHFAAWPLASISWRADVVGALLLAGLLLTVLILLRHKRFRIIAAVVLIGAVAVVLPVRILRAQSWPPPGYLIAMCAVGQGDAAVIPTSSSGSAIVVDTGPDPDLLDDCLKRLGIVTVPLIILSHSHSDHVDGLPGLLRNRSVGMMWLGVDPTNPRRYDDLMAQVQAVGADSSIPEIGQWANIDGVTVEVLGPKPLLGTDNDSNNNSLVARATIGRERILLTGDVEIAAQRELLRAQQDLTAEILKVPHHGSAKVLPEFFAAVHPRVALIGVGADNDFGHPTRTALDYLAAAGNPVVLRTDTDGDIAVARSSTGELATLTHRP